MGVLDFLIEVIGLTDAQKLEIGSWYERHVAYYKILEVNREEIKAENLIINKIYTVYDPQDHIFNSPFKKGMIIFGGLVPFNDKWYWSGSQRELTTKEPEQEIARNFQAKYPSINYRYNKETLEKAKTRMLENHHYFKAYFKSDFVEFSTGIELADASFEKLLYEQKQRLSSDDYQAQLLKFEEAGITAKSIKNKAILESEEGLCLFHNPAVGEEIITNYHKIKGALQKKGKGLSMEDIDTIQHIFQDSSISLDLLKRLIKDFGSASIAQAFYIKKRPKYWVDYLLRKMKGRDFRNRYPMISIIDSDE